MTHAGVKELFCEKCGKLYANINSFTLHKFRCTGENWRAYKTKRMGTDKILKKIRSPKKKTEMEKKQCSPQVKKCILQEKKRN